jgi:hypothetical protein
VLAERDLGDLFGDVGPVLVVGSYLAGLMCWRDLDAGQGRWRIDLSVWLRDLHGHVADWHTRLRGTITDQQRLAVLRIKDVWHRLPSYPDEVSGWEVDTAVLRDGVGTPEQSARWLAANAGIVQVFQAHFTKLCAVRPLCQRRLRRTAMPDRQTCW